MSEYPDRPSNQNDKLPMQVAQIALRRIAILEQENAIGQAILKAELERAAKLTKANEALQATIDALTIVSDLDEFVPRVLQIVAQTFEIENCAFYEHSSDETIYLRYWLLSERVLQPDELLALDGDRFALVRRLADGFTVPNAYLGTPVRQRTRAIVLDHNAGTAVPEFDAFACENGWNIELNVPLVVDGFADGAMIIYAPTGTTFTPAEIGLAEALGKQLALAMQASRLAAEGKYRAVEIAIAQEQEKVATQRAAQLAKTNITLKKTLDVLATEPDLDRVIGHVLQVMSEQLECSSSALWLLNSDLDTFRLNLVYLNGSIIPATPENANRLNNQWIRDRNLSRDLTLKDHIRARRPVIYNVDNVKQITPPSRKFLECLGVKTMLGVPLLLDAKIVGSLTIRFNERREFQVEELELTQALAHQATLAIQLLRRAEEAKQAVLLEERNRLAGEIHDTLAQAFSGISIQLGVAKRIAHQDPQEVQQILDRALEQAQAGLAEARRSIWALYLDATKYTDLAQSLSTSVEQLTNSTPVRVELNIQDTTCTLPAIVSMNLLRIGQEALLNVLKHAQATTIWIDLTCESQEVSLSVRDNGRGFTLPANQDSASGGFGLLGMYQRTERIGGQLTIATQPGHGTEVLVYAPLSLIKSNHEPS